MAPPSQFVPGLPSSVINIVQTGLLERAFYDSLYPALLFRDEAIAEMLDGNSGTDVWMTRACLLKPTTKPLVPGTDPNPQTPIFEQWPLRVERFGSSIDTHMPTSHVANADLFVSNVKTLGLAAGQTVNRLPRNALFKAYLSGQTVTTDPAGPTDTSVRVAALNGFTDVIGGVFGARPVPVSMSKKLPVTIPGVGTRNVIMATPIDGNDPSGPGILTLDAPLGVAIPARTPVLSIQAPTVIRSGGGMSIDAMGASDIFEMNHISDAVATLRRSNVQPHSDGYYHCHINASASAQIMRDPAFQRMMTALPDHPFHQEAFVGCIAGCQIFLNNENPDYLSAGDRVPTSADAFYSEDIGAETTNDTGVNIGRVLITGSGCIVEKYIDEAQYVSEAGITGRTGDFTITNNGLQIVTNRTRLILRAPLDRLQEMVSSSWSASTGFACPSDASVGGPQRYKRAIVIEHAMSMA